MYGLDEEHTSFLTDQGLYHYKVMSFGLKKSSSHVLMASKQNAHGSFRKNNESVH